MLRVLPYITRVLLFNQNSESNARDQREAAASLLVRGITMPNVHSNLNLKSAAPLVPSAAQSRRPDDRALGAAPGL